MAFFTNLRLATLARGRAGLKVAESSDLVLDLVIFHCFPDLVMNFFEFLKSSDFQTSHQKCNFYIF